MKKLLFMLIIMSSATAYGEVRIESGGGSAYLRGTMVDIHADIGYAYKDKILAAKARVGGTLVLDPFFLTLGPTVEIKSKLPTTFGLQAEMMHLGSGLWLQLSPMVDIKGEAGGSVAAGWSILGVEYQEYINRKKLSPMLFVKLRMPFSLIYYAIERPWNK
jgi:hypothetical protein